MSWDLGPQQPVFPVASVTKIEVAIAQVTLGEFHLVSIVPIGSDIEQRSPEN